MLNFIDKLSHITMKSIRDILTVFIYGILLISIMYINFDISVFDESILMSRIFISFFLNYTLGYLLSYFIFKTTNTDSKVRILLFVFALIFAMVSLFLFIPNLSFGFKALFFVLYLLTWNNGMKTIFEDEDIIENRNKFFLNIIFILILLLINSVFQNDIAVNKIIKVYLPVYFTISILYLMHLSLVKAYIGKGKNTINMRKNINKFSVLSITISGFTLILLMSNFFGLGNLKIVSQLTRIILKAIEKVLIIISYPVALLLSKITELISSKTDENAKLIDNVNKAVKQPDNGIESIMGINNPVVDIILEALKWGIFSAILIITVYSIWKKVKDYYNFGAEVSEDGEEKDFVLNVKDIRQSINRRLKVMHNKIKNLSTNSKKDIGSLHVIRRLYIGAVMKLNRKGNLFKSHYTPNEYLSNINDDKYIVAGFNKLTQHYNDVRYGHKELDSSEINECIYIKDNIDKLD